MTTPRRHLVRRPSAGLRGLASIGAGGQPARQIPAAGRARQRRRGLKGLSKDLLDCTAGLAALRREDAMAARFAGAARARLDEVGIQREPVDEVFVAPLIAQVRERLGAPVYTAAHDAGHALGADAAMAEVKEWLAEPPTASIPERRRASDRRAG